MTSSVLQTEIQKQKFELFQKKASTGLASGQPSDHYKN